MPELLAPRPHQHAALAGIAKTFSIHDRARLLYACGTGKTLIGRWHAQAADAALTIVFIPSLALVAQTLGDWQAAADPAWEYEALIICSDPSTAAGKAERDGAGNLLDEAAGPGARQRCPVTTSPARAATALRRARAHGGRLVVFSTYHSAPVVAAACHNSGEQFDLMICDEAHHLAGRPRDDFRLALSDESVPARKRLFMTATPKIPDADGTLSMDDETLFGPVAATMSFAEAIDAGLLADYRVLVIADPRVRDGRSRSRGRDPLAVPGALLSAAADRNLRSVVTFHTYVDDAKAFAGLLDGLVLRNGRTVHARHVSARHSGARRTEALHWLGADTGGRELRVLSSSRCLDEGVDVPGVDGAVFADPRKSAAGIIQASARALRTAPGKRTAAIIIPVTLDETAADDDTDLIGTRFGHVWMVLRALRAHDERFAAELDQAAAAMHQARARSGGHPGRRFRRVQFILPDDTRLDEDHLRLRMADAVSGDSAFERFYALLQDYAAATGGAFLPFNTTWKNQQLGQWAHRQRSARKEGLLPAARAARLEAIPGWTWSAADGHWQENLRRLRHLAGSRPEGLAQPPAGPSLYEGLTDSRNVPLSRHAANLRQLHRDGMLPTDQVADLEQLPGWDWSAGLPAEDIAMVQALRLFGEFEKHADVPEAHIENSLPLGRWAVAVRRRKITGRLHPALEEEIDAASPRTAKGSPTFKWMHNEARWRLAYAALRQFTAREGTAGRIPGGHVEQLPDADVRLAQWCGLQRHQRRSGTLDPHHEAWLDQVPGWVWDPSRRRVEPEEPLDLGDPSAHGRPKGVAAGCKCELCLTCRRETDLRHLRRKAEERLAALGGPASAAQARTHLAALERQGGKRTQIAATAGVPLAVVKKIAAGTDIIAAAHDLALRAVTAEMLRSAPTRTGSRGRTVTRAADRVPAGPTRELLADLASRGFGPNWVARELGYATLQFAGPGALTVTRRIADQVQDLHARTGNLIAPRAYRNQKIPSLARLLAGQLAS